MRAVIMAGGKGMRLRPYTNVLPKPLIPLSSQQPILEIIINQLVHYGFKRVTLTVNYNANLIMNYFGEGERFGVDIDYIVENEPLGTAGSLGLSTDIDEPFLLMNADILTDLDYSELYKKHINSDVLATVMSYKHEVKIDFGTIEVAENGIITDYLEKPVSNYLISSGIYMLNPAAIQYIPKAKMDMPDLIKRLLKEQSKVMSYVHTGVWIDIGTFPQLQKADEMFTNNQSLFIKEQHIKSKNDWEQVEKEKVIYEY